MYSALASTWRLEDGRSTLFWLHFPLSRTGRGVRSLIQISFSVLCRWSFSFRLTFFRNHKLNTHYVVFFICLSFMLSLYVIRSCDFKLYIRKLHFALVPPNLLNRRTFNYVLRLESVDNVNVWFVKCMTKPLHLNLCKMPKFDEGDLYHYSFKKKLSKTKLFCLHNITQYCPFTFQTKIFFTEISSCWVILRGKWKL